jgi:hypothetical protein
MIRADMIIPKIVQLMKSSGHSLSRFPRGQSFDQAIRQGAQSIQRRVSFSCAESQLFSDIFSAFVVAAVWKNAASFLQGYFHLGDRAIVDPTHRPSQHLIHEKRQAAACNRLRLPVMLSYNKC